MREQSGVPRRNWGDGNGTGAQLGAVGGEGPREGEGVGGDVREVEAVEDLRQNELHCSN